MPYHVQVAVRQGFLDRNWIAGAGGDLYFDGQGGATHPHLHLKIEGRGTVLTVGDIRSSAKMLAYSTGQQHLGIPGRTFLRLADNNFVQGTISTTQRNNDFLSQAKIIDIAAMDMVINDPATNAGIRSELTWWRDHISQIST